MEYLVITAPGTTWKDRAAGFDKIDFPVMPDSTGSVFNLYSATLYDLFLVDKKLQLVTRQTAFKDSTRFEQVKQRIRQLYVE